MLTPEQIERIEAFERQGARVLSVYLDLDPTRQVRRSSRIVFEDVVKDARERLEGPARRERLVEHFQETVRGRGRATRGVTPTLEALSIGSVQSLVVSAGVHPDASECSNCRQLWPRSLALCPSCDHPMRTVHDLFHRAVERAHAQAARVEVVHGAAARHLQEACGGLRALQRYR